MIRDGSCDSWAGEAAIGVEPMVEVLQTSALPLGYAAVGTGCECYAPGAESVKKASAMPASGSWAFAHPVATTARGIP
jgi:hypothetical protein